jgi:DNA-binding NarL/FixJ family response regulator
MKPVRLLIADPLDLVADGLRWRLANEAGFVVVGHVRDGRLLFDSLATMAPDLVLLDVSLPGIDGIDATRRLHKRHPHLRILAHSIRMEIE